MTITVELTRVGTSRTSVATIPIEARIVCGTIKGQNILGKQRMTDINSAKRTVVEYLRGVYGRREIEVEWIGDAPPEVTHDVEMGQWKAGTDKGLLDRSSPLMAEKQRRGK